MKGLALALSLVLGALAPLALLGCSDDDAPGGTADGGAVTDAGPGVDSGLLPADADPRAPDANLVTGPDGSVGVACGDQPPCTGTDECCVTQAGGGGAAEFECIPAGATCSGATVGCDGPEDCDGNACCGTLGGGGGLGGASAECTGDDACSGQQLQFCHNQADCPGAVACCESAATGGGYCKPASLPQCI